MKIFLATYYINASTVIDYNAALRGMERLIAATTFQWGL